MAPETKIIVTADGSHSLYLPALNETYHSSYGALTESQHVFIEAGLAHYHKTHSPRVIRLLEVGFGTGLNALLAREFALKQQVPVYFTSLEPFPLQPATYEKLNYAETPESRAGFLELHRTPWDKPQRLDAHFSLHKVKTRLEDFQTNEQFEVIFYDAFSPGKQAELWQYEILEKVVGFLAAGAVLVTYCAKGQFKRDLAALGLDVETLPGPPGKKEMVRGIRKLRVLSDEF